MDRVDDGAASQRVDVLAPWHEDPLRPRKFGGQPHWTVFAFGGGDATVQQAVEIAASIAASARASVGRADDLDRVAHQVDQ